jgi:hypothetical protein
MDNDSWDESVFVQNALSGNRRPYRAPNLRTSGKGPISK